MLTAHTGVGINAYIFVQVDRSIFIHSGSAHLHSQRIEKSGVAGLGDVDALASHKPGSNLSKGFYACIGGTNSDSSIGSLSTSQYQ